MFSSKFKLILTPKGMQNLASLEAELTALSVSEQEPNSQVIQFLSKDGYSAASNSFLTTVLKIVRLLLEHNDKNYWKNENHQIAVGKLFATLDQQQGTHVPPVFNEQSYQTAKCLLHYFARLDFKTELTPAFMGWSGRAANFVKQCIANLKFNITGYECVKQQPKHMQNFQDLYLSFQVIENELIQACQKRLNEHEWCLLRDRYATTIFMIMNAAEQQFPWVCFEDGARYVNNQRPYTFKEAELFRLRGKMLEILIQGEIKLNELLLAQKLEPLTTVYALCQQRYPIATLELQFDQQRAALCLIFGRFKEQAKLYLKASHLKESELGTFRSINKLKRTLVMHTLTELETVVMRSVQANKMSLPQSAFACYQKLILASNQNTDIAQMQNIACGQLSRLLHSFARRFLNLLFTMNAATDVPFIQCLNKYEVYLASQQNMAPRPSL